MEDYLQDFIRESEENVTELNNSLLELEDDPSDEAAMDSIFRTAHTLKGNFGAMGFDNAATVAHAVEDKHYPDLPPAHSVPFGEALRDTINFLGVIIGANTLALILYAIFTPFAPLIFVALNGYLLGMEYFQLAAMRRVGRAGAKALRRKHRLTIWTAGILMALPLSVPVVNLLIPILGAATFTHIYHVIQSRSRG